MNCRQGGVQGLSGRTAPGDESCDLGKADGEAEEGRKLVGLRASLDEIMDKFVARPKARSVGSFWISL